ncbi:MAG: VPLPA-CTERM sorting domain-containing protein, partial [Planctomycetota bacterium]
RKKAVTLSSVATTAAMALMLAGPANAASVSYFLDQSNHLPDGTNYLKVTIDDQGLAGVINFTLDQFDTLSDLSKCKLGIVRFGFNGDELDKSNIVGLPDGWKLKNEKNIAGFGRYENVLFGKPLTDSLTFSIVGVDGDSIYSYAESHDGGKGLFFSALVNGTCKHCGEHDHRRSRSGTFGGSTLDAAPVPLPAAAWMFGSGLLGLIGVARRKTQHAA